MMKKAKIIAVANQKGGVGKTTSAINLATAFAIMEKKTLIIDLDSQGNCSTGFGIEHSARSKTIYQALFGQYNIQNTIIKCSINNLYIISSNNNLSAAEFELANLDSREFIMKELISNIAEDFDYIIIDCPPSLGLLTINALTAADEILIPLQCEFYALEGLSNLLKIIDKVQKNLNPDLKICGVLLTMYDRRSNLTILVENDVRNCLGNLVFKTTIPRNIKLSEAPSHGMPALIYDHKCMGSIAYMMLTKEILQNHNAC